MNARARVYRSDGAAHWRCKRRRFGSSGTWLEHVEVAVVTLMLLPLSVVVLVTTRWVLLPLLDALDRKRGRRE